MKYCTNLNGLSNIEVYPSRDKGTNFHLMVTQIKSTRPVTNVGNEVARSTKTDELVSGQRFLNLAATIPKPIPTVSQRRSAPIATLIVIGSASVIMLVTQAFSLKE